MDPQYSDVEEQSFGSKIKAKIIELIEFVAIVGAILIVLRFFIAEPHKVSGRSMLPNFHDGDYIITNKIGLRFSPPQRGEVIILQNPRNEEQVFIKRVIALPLDHIRISEGKVFINGTSIKEPYLSENLKTQGEAYLAEDEEITIAESQYFVMGDNRSESSDSREWGPVTLSKIIGQAWFRYLPLQKFGFINVDARSADPGEFR